jgi:hypothetical protein
MSLYVLKKTVENISVVFVEISFKNSKFYIFLVVN